MGRKETNIGEQARLDLSPEFKLFRNNRGVAKFREKKCRCKITSRVRYGVGPNGASDYIGFRSVVITPEMVGKTIAQFAVIEAKDTGEKPEPEQYEFIDNIRAAGGFAGWFDGPEMVQEIKASAPGDEAL